MSKGFEGRAPGHRWLAIPVLFFISGAAGLVYEVVWMRLLAGVSRSIALFR